jgi:hypothetical protein
VTVIYSVYYSKFVESMTTIAESAERTGFDAILRCAHFPKSGDDDGLKAASL